MWFQTEACCEGMSSPTKKALLAKLTGLPGADSLGSEFPAKQTWLKSVHSLHARLFCTLPMEHNVPCTQSFPEGRFGQSHKLEPQLLVHLITRECQLDSCPHHTATKLCPQIQYMFCKWCLYTKKAGQPALVEPVLKHLHKGKILASNEPKMQSTHFLLSISLSFPSKFFLSFFSNS